MNYRYALAAALLTVLIAVPYLVCAQHSSDAPIQRSRPMTNTHLSEPLACTLGAMTSAQQQRHDALAAQLRRAVTRVKDLPDGYAFEYASDPAVFVAAAEFITLEHRCCPFYHFRLEQESNDGLIRLSVTGPHEAKTYIKPFLSPEVPKVGKAYPIPSFPLQQGEGEDRPAYSASFPFRKGKVGMGYSFSRRGRAAAGVSGRAKGSPKKYPEHFSNSWNI